MLHVPAILATLLVSIKLFFSKIRLNLKKSVQSNVLKLVRLPKQSELDQMKKHYFTLGNNLPSTKTDSKCLNMSDSTFDSRDFLCVYQDGPVPSRCVPRSRPLPLPPHEYFYDGQHLHDGGSRCQQVREKKGEKQECTLCSSKHFICRMKNVRIERLYITVYACP